MTAPSPQHPRRIIRHKKKKPRKRITGHAQRHPIKLCGVFGDASNECSSQGCPTRPSYGGARKSICTCGHCTLIDRFLTCTLFVKEQRRKNLRGYALKIFRTLDNNEILKINTRAERFSAPRLNCFIFRRSFLRRTPFPADASAGCQIILARSECRIQARLLKFLVSRVS